MDKAEFIKRYGEEKYENWLEKGREWNRKHPNLTQAYSRKRDCKDGERYEDKRNYQMNGIPHVRGLVRCKHRRKWRPYKHVIAPESQIHHEWIPGTADYKRAALVEAIQHQYGIIDPVVVLEGEITLLTEAEIRGT